MNREEEWLAKMEAKTVLDIIEKFIVSLASLRKCADEILPTMRAVGEEELAGIFETSTIFFKVVCGEENKNLENLSMDEITIYQIFIDHLNNWIRLWLISLEKITPNTEWKETFELCHQLATKQGMPELAKLFYEFQDIQPNQEFDRGELLTAIREARRLLDNWFNSNPSS